MHVRMPKTSKKLENFQNAVLQINYIAFETVLQQTDVF